MAKNPKNPPNPAGGASEPIEIQVQGPGFVLVQEENGFITIRKARTPREKMSPNFEELKSGALQDMRDARIELLIQLYALELNIQGMQVLREESVGFIKTESRCLH